VTCSPNFKVTILFNVEKTDTPPQTPLLSNYLAPTALKLDVTPPPPKKKILVMALFTLNISEMATDTAIVAMEGEKKYFKVTIVLNIK